MSTKTMNEWIKVTQQLWKEFRDIISKIANIPTKNKEEIYYQTRWDIIRDIRMISQVIENKPRHLVKKIIR